MEILVDEKMALRLEAKLDLLMGGNATQDVRLAIIETKIGGSLQTLAERVQVIEDRVARLEASVSKLVAYASIFSAGGSALMSWALKHFAGI